LERLSDQKEQDPKKGTGIIWTEQEGETPIPLFVILNTITTPSFVRKDEDDGRKH